MNKLFLALILASSSLPAAEIVSIDYEQNLVVLDDGSTYLFADVSDFHVGQQLEETYDNEVLTYDASHDEEFVDE